MTKGQTSGYLKVNSSRMFGKLTLLTCVSGKPLVYFVQFYGCTTRREINGRHFPDFVRMLCGAHPIRLNEGRYIFAGQLPSGRASSRVNALRWRSSRGASPMPSLVDLEMNAVSRYRID